LSTAVQLPHWDMMVVYPSLESSEFERAFNATIEQINKLLSLFDERGIDEQGEGKIDDATIDSFERVAADLNALLTQMQTVTSFVYSFVTTDSRDQVAQARWSELQQQSVRVAQLATRFTAWIGSLDVEELIRRSKVAADHSFRLRKEKEEAQHLMSPAEENLAAQLSVTGGGAWGKLHGNMTSQLMVEVWLPTGVQDVPMSVARNMAFDPDRDVRRAAYEAELKAWESVAVPLAAAINSIKGEGNAVEKRRGWSSALDVALFNNNIDRQTLDAMMESARASFPDFRRYLWLKAEALGVNRLVWFDIFAPVGKTGQTWEFEQARDFLLDQFGTYSSRLRDFADRSFREHWIDAEPRPGKRDGAFCMPLRGDESRVLSNFRPTYDGMSTLAHELGHAYHNFNLANRDPLQKETPMALAETASIFCQTIVREAALQRGDDQEQIAILEASLQDNCQVVVDITSRFLFEQRVFEARRQRELSVEELNYLMLEAQRETYGEGLDQLILHPYMWAVKSHYYSSGRAFYNFPYMFGLLFGLGLYARFQEDPEGFKEGYDQLLSSTGLADAASLAQSFDIDIRGTDFWNSSFDLIRADIDRFESLVAGTKIRSGGSS
jgi:oligoendopeptidase F